MSEEQEHKSHVREMELRLHFMKSRRPEEIVPQETQTGPQTTPRAVRISVIG
jgi:hypothetical protein